MRLIAFALVLANTAGGQVPVIVDTDAGADDVIALLWLMRQPAVKLEAVTIAQGLAHPAEGAETMLRLLEAGGLTGVPVYVGGDRPVRGGGVFPTDWRTASDRLLRDEFPAAKRRPEAKGAAQFLADRLMDARRPVRVLALGPLTNIAAAMALEPRTGIGLKELIWMGGAMAVPGNVTQAPTAEWNAWVDPEAAERVLRGDWHIRIVPLDATNKARIAAATLRLFEEEAREWASTIVLRLLRGEDASIRAGTYYGWDVLAAMCLLERPPTTEHMMAVAVRRRPGERGRLVRVEGARPNAMVAVTANAEAFARHFRTLLP